MSQTEYSEETGSTLLSQCFRNKSNSLANQLSKVSQAIYDTGMPTPSARISTATPNGEQRQIAECLQETHCIDLCY